MKSQKMNRRALLIRFLICLAILAALGCAYWVNMRSGRIRNAKRIAQAIAEDVQDRMNGIRKYAGIAAAWLDASGDEAKKALSDPGKAEKYRDTFGKIASALYDPDDMDSILLIAGETVALGYPESDSSDLRGKTPALGNGAGEAGRSRSDADLRSLFCEGTWLPAGLLHAGRTGGWLIPGRDLCRYVSSRCAVSVCAEPSYRAGV